MVDYYKYCESIMKMHAKTFYLASLSLPNEVRKHFWSVYAYCRVVDNIADDYFLNTSKESALRKLETIRTNLILSFEGNYKGREPIFLALSETFRSYKFDIKPFLELIDGAVWDIEGTTIERLDDLINYSKLVAGSVGAMLIPIMTEQLDDEIVKNAYKYGIFMQIVNILRDVGEDYKLRNRIYIPRALMHEFSVSEFEIKHAIITPNYVDLMEYLMELAENLFFESYEYISFLRDEIRSSIKKAGIWYLEILNAIRLNGYDNITKRAYVQYPFKIVSLFLPYNFRKSILKAIKSYKYFRYQTNLDATKEEIIKFHSDFKNAEVNLPFGTILADDTRIEAQKVIEFVVKLGFLKKRIKLYVLQFNDDELIDYFDGWFHIHRFYDNKVLELVAYKNALLSPFLWILFRIRELNFKKRQYLLDGL